MNKLILIIGAILVAASIQAAKLTAYDMASYGTAASITNNAFVDEPIIKSALITYDAASTNTMTVYLRKSGIDYQIGTASVSNEVYSSIDLTDIVWSKGDVLKITTTITNVNVLIQSE